LSYFADPNRPIYIQIIEEIKRRTARGIYNPGGQIPSVRELAKEIEVNPNTVARAYMELEREGFIFTRRGQGSFITEDSNKIEMEIDKIVESAAVNFLNEIKALNLEETHRQKLLEEIWNKLIQ
jgi:GntR family transcriptional regulator